MTRPFWLALPLALATCGDDTTAPASSCGNPLAPVAFRVVHRATSAMREDTTPRLVNRYLNPTRSRDTVPYREEDGRFRPGAFLIVVSPLGDAYCVTYLDSVIHHDERAKFYFPAP